MTHHDVPGLTRDLLAAIESEVPGQARDTVVLVQSVQAGMTGKIINLRRARKRKVRGDARAEADANAARHGEAKAERSLRAARDDLEARRLDGHQLTPLGADDADDRE